MTTTSPIDALTLALTNDPTDTLTRLALADALADVGRDAEAKAERTKAAELVELRIREAKAAAIRQQLIAAGQPSNRVFTRLTAKIASGYWARNAEDILSGKTDLLVVVFGDEAVTKSGLHKDCNSPILYYRKSRGGRYARSVQKFRVSL